MKAIALNDAFGTENLQMVERPITQLQPGQVMIRVKAASLNYRDLLMVTGAYNPNQKLPLIPVSDGVGEVIEAGPGVERIQSGMRVCPTFAPNWISGPPTRERIRDTRGGPLDGLLQQYIVVDEHHVVSAPRHLSDVEAATLPCAAVTAWNALVEQRHMKAGETIVVQGSGGVALFALQFAKVAGARVIALSRDEAKLERLQKLGADWTINTVAQPNWGTDIRRETGGLGADLVVDVGGSETITQSLSALRVGGTLSLIGVLSGAIARLDIRPILMKSICVQGMFVGNRDSFESMNRAIIEHEIRPTIDRTFSFEETQEAFAYLERGTHFGKIGIDISSYQK